MRCEDATENEWALLQPTTRQNVLCARCWRWDSLYFIIFIWNIFCCCCRRRRRRCVLLFYFVSDIRCALFVTTNGYRHLLCMHVLVLGTGTLQWRKLCARKWLCYVPRNQKLELFLHNWYGDSAQRSLAHPHTKENVPFLLYFINLIYIRMRVVCSRPGRTRQLAVTVTILSMVSMEMDSGVEQEMK